MGKKITNRKGVELTNKQFKEEQTKILVAVPSEFHNVLITLASIITGGEYSENLSILENLVVEIKPAISKFRTTIFNNVKDSIDEYFNQYVL